MANTYVIQSVSYPTNAPNADVLVTAVGTVNGVPVTVTCWFSQYIAHAGSVISAENYIISLMLIAYNQTLSAVPPNAPAGGTTIVQ